MIASKYGSPKSTKDGVTVAKSIEFSNPLENAGAQLVRTVASKTNDQAGDGTTTASVLTLAIFEEGVEKVAGGLNPMDIYRGVQKGSLSLSKFFLSKSSNFLSFISHSLCSHRFCISRIRQIIQGHHLKGTNSSSRY